MVPKLGEIVLLSDRLGVNNRPGLVVSINPAKVAFVVLTETGPKITIAKNMVRPDLVTGTGLVDGLKLVLPVMLSPICTKGAVKRTRAGIWSSQLDRRGHKSERLFFSQVDHVDPVVAVRGAWDVFTKRWAKASKRYGLGFIEFDARIGLGSALMRSAVPYRMRLRRPLADWRSLVNPLVGRHPEQILDGRATPTS